MQFYIFIQDLKHNEYTSTFYHKNWIAKYYPFKNN